MSEPYDINYTCSLGPRCHTACLLKNNHLKKASYPFDWIFSNIDMVIHCLEDRFTTFLDKSYFTIQNDTSESQQHSYYCESQDDHVFNHRNPLKPDDYNYYVRCVERFNDLLKTKDNKLFVLFFLNYVKIDDAFKRRIIEFNNKFKHYTSHYGILCIIQYVDNANTYEFSSCENIHFLEIYTKSKSNGLQFEDPQDDIFLNNLIMQTYKFNLYEIYA